MARATRPCLPSILYPLSSILVFSSNVLAVSSPTLGGTGTSHPLLPVGPQSDRIAHLYWLSFTICTVMFFLVVGATLLATILHSRKPAAPTPQTTPNPRTERLLTITVGAAVLVSTILLFVLLFADFTTGRAIHTFSEKPNPVTIKVVGHQWWWEVIYTDKEPQNVFTTANEMHIPTGRPVKVDLDSGDVIHSFWVPSIAGKKDAIPGHPTSIYFQADKPGTYVGECAEFCGYQHAKMHFIVTAERQEDFDKWLAGARTTSRPPLSETEKRGYLVFMGSTCSMCHTIGGTPARGRLGPDLTHVGSRPTLAAGSLPNTKGNLGGWIMDPQHLKPGVHMPRQNLTGQDLQGLIDYLEHLQ